MKKMMVGRVLPLVLTLVLLAGSLPLTAAAAAMGDVNGDGAINAADALLALQHSVRLLTLEGEKARLADVNGDGAVNAGDALLILQYSVKLIPGFPADNASMPWSPDTPTVIQKGEAAATNPVRTTYQQNGNYSGQVDVQSDAVMAYISGLKEIDRVFDSWKNNNQSGRRIDVMIPAGRDTGEYYTLYPDRGKKDTATKADGSIHLHPAGTVDYMVPTTAYTEYKWTVVDAICKKGPGAIVLEEPEIFINSIYCEGFYDEWKAYYGSDFVDPSTSAEARYMACKLAWHLWVRYFDLIGSRMAEQYPDVQLGIAAHSTSKYISHTILSAQDGYTALPYVKIYIGQTWSDTARFPRYYAGKTTREKIFEAAYYEYGSYGDSMNEGQTLYSLTDAKADDGSQTWDTYEYLWQETVVAELMRPEICHFQECVWPARGFTPAPARYRTVQLAVYNVLHEVGPYATTLYAGTPGIYLGQSDSASFQYGFMMSAATYPGIDGLSLPLIERGIPLNTLALDQIRSAQDLADVKLLMLSWDYQKPLSEQVNAAIADWVKNGGVLLYIGGHNDYDTVPGEWWTQKGLTPLQDLYGKLGLSGVTVGAMEPYLSFYDWVGPAGYGQSFGGDKYLSNEANFALSFTGSGFTKLVENEDAAFIVESAAGKGHVITVGLPAAYFGMNENGPEQIRDLVAYACRYLDSGYQETDLMAIQRGPYVAAHNLSGEDKVLTGEFVDLFDENLPVITQKTVPAGRSALLYDLTEARRASTPLLIHTGGNLRGEVTQTAERTAFTVSGPTATDSVTRFIGNGRAPVAVNLTLNGEVYKDFIALWDNAASSLSLTLSHDAAQELEVEVLWGTDPVPDTEPYVWRKTRITAGQDKLDAPYVVRDTAQAMRTMKLVQYDNELVYKYSLADLRDPYLIVEVLYNYLVQVSTDGQTWTTLYDRSTVDDAYVTSASSRVSLTVIPTPEQARGDFYVRFGNSDSMREYGTGVSAVILHYKETVN